MRIRAGARRHLVTLAVLTVSALALSACTPAADANSGGPAPIETALPSDVTERLDAALAEAVTLSGSSGAIAGVWAPWAGKWVVAPGSTTREGSIPLSTDMSFRIGANTQSMTCTVLLKLVDEGKVQLSDEVSDYLTRVAGIEGITLGQLCQNTSGLADYTPDLAPQFVNNPTRYWPPMEVVASGLARDRVSTPGGAWAASNTGFVLLGMALEEATTQDWATLYRQYIFDPLGMDDTELPEADELTIDGPHPHGYATALNPAGQLVCETVRDDTALSNSMYGVSGGVVSTVDDLRTWAHALATGALLSEKSADAQWATVPLGTGAPSWHSFGLGVQQLGPMRGHDGAIPGFLSAMFSDPSSGLTVVVMLNNSSAGAGFARTLVQRLASIVSKTPAAGSETAPLLELPWSEEQTVATMQAVAVCPPPAEPAPEEPAPVE